MCKVLVDDNAVHIGGTCSVCGGEIIPVRIYKLAESRYGPGSEHWKDFVERMRMHEENMAYYARRRAEQWFTTSV